ncbi:hypothetical protein AVEN_253189-1 [Araneus ventricosus]|uniref:Uncharacterized protein n=1 Tax=Araneus ventricosus TaxID=182803 RepID=A0A4Y2W860_ARAVE|nr:hypothetical protein AVEN_253189-1 [Araneus ventricosus]
MNSQVSNLESSFTETVRISRNRFLNEEDWKRNRAKINGIEGKAYMLFRRADLRLLGDRLKPAYILAEDNSKATTTDHIKLQTSDNKPDLTQKQSRTGRTIRLPVRFKD